jgi:hypothetical protein
MKMAAMTDVIARDEVSVPDQPGYSFAGRRSGTSRMSRRRPGIKVVDDSDCITEDQRFLAHCQDQGGWRRTASAAAGARSGCC